jgi:hypothetical protein
VVGGGPAGIAAALAAAGRGARTLLLEREARLGGNVGQALVHTICGLYHAADDGDAREAHAGLPSRLAAALQRSGAASAPERAGRVWYLPIESAGLVELTTRWCDAAPSLRVAYGSPLRSAGWTDGGVELTFGPEAAGRATAAIAIDTSGDASLAHVLGATVDQASPEQLQHPSYLFRLAGVDAAAFEGFARMRITHAIAGAVRAGVLPAGCDSVVVRRAPTDGGAYCTLTLAKPQDGYDPLDPGQLERLNAAAREAAEAVVTHLLKTRPEFSRARLDAWPQRVGLRETRRVRGRAVLDREHVLEGRRGEDDVALSTWPIELWHDHRRATFEYPRAACGVPLGALCAAGAPRLGMAGRCLSATHEALGAARVIATALATGEAIGMAAALAADARTTLPEVEPARVRRAVEQDGARP